MSALGELLTDLLAGDALAASLRPLWLPCRRLVLLDDFCQDVVLRALQHRESFRGTTRGELLGWLRAIARQQMIDRLRRSRLEQRSPLPPDLPGREESPAERLMFQERLAWLVQALAELEPDDRELLIRHYYRGEPLAAIARDRGISPNTLAQQHLRLLRRLRKAGPA